MSSSEWFVRVCADPPRARLFCFPYPGSSAATFQGWRQYLDPEVELVCVELPGRGRRFGQPLVTQMHELGAGMMASISPLLDLPSYFFGHSNGALMALHVAGLLRGRRPVAPAHLFLSAPPSFIPSLSAKPNDEFIAHLGAFGGAAQELLENKQLMEIMLPALRADFRIGETFQDDVALDVGATFFVGDADPFCPPHDIDRWRSRTGPSEIILFEGEHFFLSSKLRDVVGAVNEGIKRNQLSEERAPT